ncbi:MAG: DUF3344 domain-containing protein [Methanobrevibacter sp.]|nr:DUF3344 domain-containing protein [Methanobrevibacter sp.]
MKLRNEYLFIAIFLFFIILSSGIVFAEDSALPPVEDGVVSGGVEIPSVNPFSSKSGELVYQVPANVSEIKSVNVVVSSYSGSGAPTYGLTTKISLKTGNTTQILEFANLTYPTSTANDPVIYPITNLTSKQYSDYQTFVNITDKVKSLSPGDKITISVNNTELEGYQFDGRIKLIALTFAYDDNDNDKISYWLNIGQAWTKETLTTVFRTKDFNKDYDDVTLESIALSSSDATYNLNGQLLTDPIQTKGNYYIYDVWNITDTFELSKDTNFAYTSSKASTYASYKAAIQLLKVNTPENNVSATITPEYIGTVYAGVNNTLTITVNNGNKELNGSVILLIGDEEIDSSDLFVGANNKTTIKLVDPTIRPINETTVNGAKNTIVNYTLNILSSKGGVLNSTNASYKVLYNGNLGKDYEYPNANPTLREFTVTGDVIVLTNGTYSAAGDTNRTDVYNIAFDGNVSEALLYVSYNWDKNPNDDFNTWNTTFNNQVIAPIASYRDQSNLGGYGKYGYGLVVYNVTDLVVAGENTFALNKTKGNAAVYPSNLIVLTNNKKAEFEKTVYIYEEADLLSKSNNKNLPTGFNTVFDVIDDNATLYVFAAGAQAGEGNLIINGENHSDVWSGTTKSFDIYTTDVDSDNIEVYFESTGSTILGLHQMVVVVNENKTPTADITIKSEYTSVPSIYAGVINNLTVSVENTGGSTENVVVKVLMGNETISIQNIDDYAAGETYTFNAVDATIRPITENTVNGNNNEKVNYTVVVEDANGNIINSKIVSCVVVYDGYLGKDYEYPKANSTLREFVVRGEVIVLVTDEYSAGSATNRTDKFNLTSDGNVTQALLYVSYNWDKDAKGDFNNWNTTFNGKVIAPIASYRDQSNLGGASAKYGYGLVVYDVTDLVVSGVNTFEFNKTKGTSAVYPSNLIVLVENKTCPFVYDVYILEEADLLSKSYNKNLPVGFNTTFSVADGDSMVVVFAASAQAGEGNLIVNGETHTDVWNGTSNSLTYTIFDFNSTDLSVYFESTGATILGLHQMVVVINENTSSVITAPDVEKYYKGPERFVVNVADYQGNPIVNKSVEITINGVTYTKTTDKNGNASIGLGLGSGVYTVTTKFNNTTANSIVTVLSTVNGTDLVKVYQNASQYYATFRDSQGNYLAEGTTVKFNINGVLYERKVVGNQGLAKLNINLQQGDYIITAMNTATGENCANNITVLSKIIENKDITKYYKNGTQYTVKLVGDDGKAVDAGEVVTFNINGVFYNRTTNASGIAKLNINLSPGDYIITAEYKGCKVSNQITVKPVLSAEDLTKKYGTPDQFVANLLDGQGNPATGENVTFNINGEFYSRTTDSEGNAKLNIRLMPGEYIITSSYNGTNVANTIKVTA